jgi:hypothetical protein
VVCGVILERRRKTNRHRDKETKKKQRQKETKRQRDTETNRQTDKQTNRQTDKVNLLDDAKIVQMGFIEKQRDKEKRGKET